MTTNNNVGESYPDNNPKTVHGIKKVPMHLVPPSAKIALAEAFADGAAKYGPYNWREKTVSASVYIAAAQRHMDRWWDRADPDDLATDSLVHHIDHAMACLAIIKDGLTIGMLNDDRPVKGAAGRLQDSYAEKKTEKKEQYDASAEQERPAYYGDESGRLYLVKEAQPHYGRLFDTNFPDFSPAPPSIFNSGTGSRGC